MKINMQTEDSRSELWLQALSDTVVDLPRVIAAFDDEQRELFAQYDPQPVAYYPDEEADFPFADWFIFARSE